MIEALIVLAFALAAGLFGLSGIALFWLIAVAVAFLLAMAIWFTEVTAARCADVLRRLA